MSIINKNEIGEIITSTWGWHGTGRLQYNDDGQVIEVLESILEKGGLLPLVKDPWLKIEGSLKYSISIAKIRMYARIYADTMQFNDEIDYIYKSSRFWFWVIGGMHIVKRPLDVIIHLLKLQTSKDSSKQLDSLISKYRKEDNIKKQSFLKKLTNMPFTDIPGNHGIIIGIKDCSDIVFDMDDRYSLFEYRLKKRVGLEKFSYIEVPKKRVEEIDNIIRRYDLDIPIIAIEDVERYFKKRGFFKALETT
jgi:hypothetical protein